jgi:Protein of unknown function (DUF3224)
LKGGGNVKKRFSTLVVALLTVAMLATTISVVCAKTPEVVTGNWKFSNTIVVDVKFVANGATEFLKQEDTVTLDGSIVGAGKSERSLTIHNFGPDFWVTSQSLFEVDASVDGKEGTLTIRALANSQISPDGHWTIISGTKDLANLHGQGTFSHISPVEFTYEGQVHFAP